MPPARACRERPTARACRERPTARACRGRQPSIGSPRAARKAAATTREVPIRTLLLLAGGALLLLLITPARFVPRRLDAAPALAEPDFARIMADVRALAAFPTRFAASAETPAVLDWLREFGRLGDPTVLNGETVDVIGFVYRELDMADDQFMVARFTMSCCVADAYAIGLPVIYDGAPDLAEGGWVHIQGTLQVGTFRPGDDPLPIILPTLVEPTEEPDTAYLYS